METVFHSASISGASIVYHTECWGCCADHNPPKCLHSVAHLPAQSGSSVAKICVQEVWLLGCTSITVISKVS